MRGFLKMQTDLVSQTPKGSSQIDFQVRSAAVYKARNHRNPRPKLEEVLEEELTPLKTTFSQEKIRQDRLADHGPIIKGTGAESQSIYLKFQKEELERGVFKSSNKSPILTLN